MAKLASVVIGASGGIGQECVKQLHGSGMFSKVIAVSRSLPQSPLAGVEYLQVQSENESEVAAVCQQFADQQLQISLAICCIGVLHTQRQAEMPVMPEKRLEDLQAEKLQFYFHSNVIMPSLWLKNLVPVMQGPDSAKLIFLSARVGSISDNRLGGWYGYRASKAALNMLLKSAQVECQRRAKNLSLISYHPGTVNTNLSQPFQANVPKSKLFTCEFTVAQLLKVTKDLQPEQGPHFIDWQGEPIPW